MSYNITEKKDVMLNIPKMIGKCTQILFYKMIF